MTAVNTVNAAALGTFSFYIADFGNPNNQLQVNLALVNGDVS